MAKLSKEQLEVMASYPLTAKRPPSHIVPGTDSGNFPDVACWNWALTGGVDNNLGKTTPDAIYQRVIKARYSQVKDLTWPWALGRSLTKEDKKHTGLLKIITDNFKSACAFLSGSERDGIDLRNEKIARARGKIVRALAALAALENGLVPSKSETIYTLWVRTDLEDWWSWHHWAIGIEVGDGAISYVQTIPGKKEEGALYQGCKAMWDEGLDATEFLYLEELHEAHVALLDKIKPYKAE
ncbi:MAG TPA: hypothetical protein VMH86_13980 [Rhizomicrobium sp.]|nr:hypothetical protein [Rhizomicrobium sp.]